MISNDKKDKITSLGVHDLRNLARLWGVKSPTTKLKKDLIQGILKSMEENPEPPNPLSSQKTFKGRPTKQGFYKKFIDTSVPEIIKHIAKQRIFHPSQIGVPGELVFGAPVLESEFMKAMPKIGYVRRVKETYYFYDRESEDVVYIPASYIARYDIEIGDFISATTSLVLENVYIVDNIEEINNVNIQNGEYKRSLSSLSDMVAIKTPLKILNIVEGERHYFQSQDYVNFIDENYMLLQLLEQNGFIAKVVGVSLQYNDDYNIKLMFDKNNTFLSLKEHEPSFSFEMVTDAVYNSSINAREGKKVVLFVLGVSDIAKEMRKHYSLEQEINEKEIELHLYQIMRKLLYANKALNNGGSITLVLISREEECPEF